MAGIAGSWTSLNIDDMGQEKLDREQLLESVSKRASALDLYMEKIYESGSGSGDRSYKSSQVVQEDLDWTREKLQSCELICKDYVQKVERLEEDIKRKDSIIRKKTEDADSLEYLLNHSKSSQIVELISDDEVVKQHNERLSLRNRELGFKLRQVENELDSYKRKYTSLLRQENQNSLRISIMESDLKSLMNTNKHINANNMEISAQFKSLKACKIELAETKEDYQKLEKICTELRETILVKDNMVDDLQLELKTLSADNAVKVGQLENEIAMWREKCEDLECKNKNEVDSLLVDLKEQVSQIGKMRVAEEFICEICEGHASSGYDHDKRIEEENKALLLGVEEIKANNEKLLEKLKELRAEAAVENKKEFEIASLKMKIIDLNDKLAQSVLAEQEMVKRVENMDSVFSKLVENFTQQCETFKQSNEEFKNFVTVLKIENENQDEEGSTDESSEENSEIQELREKLKGKEEEFDLLEEENKQLNSKLSILTAENAAIKETQKNAEKQMENLVQEVNDLRATNRSTKQKVYSLRQLGFNV